VDLGNEASLNSKKPKIFVIFLATLEHHPPWTPSQRRPLHFLTVFEMHITFASHGPEKRPSIFSWINRAPEHVYIGPPTAALRGSGFEHDEACHMEQEVTRYIHFYTAPQIEDAVKSFNFVPGTDYVFGYHVELLPMHLVAVFIGKIQTRLTQLGLNFTMGETTTTHLNTAYIMHFAGGPAELARFLPKTYYRTSQHLFIGVGTIWQDLALEATRTSFPAALAALVAADAGDARECELVLEVAIGHDPMARVQWQTQYRALVERHLATRAAPRLQNGTTFWLDVTNARRCGYLPGDVEVCVHRAQARPGCVPLYDHLVGDSALRTVYEMHPALLRAEVLVRLFFEGDCEIRLAADEACGEVEAEVSKITLPSVCMSCVRIMPDLTPAQREKLKDPGQMAFVLEEVRGGREYHACCIEAMLNPYIMDVYEHDPKFYNVNPAMPPPTSDRRTTIFTTHAPQQTPFLPLDKLIWDAENKTDVFEMVPVRRYMCRYNYPQCTLEDYHFMVTHPEGGLDHLANFHTDTEVRALNTPGRRLARVAERKRGGLDGQPHEEFTPESNRKRPMLMAAI
jgi:hypothetical protein